MIALLATFSLPALAQEEQTTVVDLAMEDDRFSTLVSLLDEAGLVEALEEEGPYTIFAPTNEAFEALPAETLEELRNSPADLNAVLMYHVVNGEYGPEALSELGDVPTLQGDALPVLSEGDTLRVDIGTVTEANLQADNGVIHVIDTVLVPENVANALQ